MPKDFYLRKRDAIYYVKYRAPDGTILTAKSTGQTNKTAAERWARENQPDFTRPVTTLREWAVPFYGDHCPHVTRLRAEGRAFSERQRKNCRRYLDQDILQDPLCEKKLSEINRADILDYRARLIARVGQCRSCQASFATLKVIIREALFRDLIPRDPFLGVGMPAYTPKPRTALDKTSLAQLLRPEAYANRLHWLMTMCAALTGMRAGEVRGLQWQDLQPGRILITKALSQDNSDVSLPKWGKVRSCPYPEALAALLEPLRYAAGPVRPSDWVFQMDHTPVGYRYWAEAVRRAGKGIPGASIHTLRHTLNTRLREAGISDELLRGSFGWSAPAIHDNYTHRDKYDYTGQAAAIDEIMGAQSESN